MNFNVATITDFDKEAKRLAKKYPSLRNDLSKLIKTLGINPFQGSSIGNGFYKIRLTIKSKGKGKSGGGRVITYVKVSNETVFLVTIYDKADRETITDSELKLLAKLIP
jgi:mRNA-degrading endonuclease RelE of RelBE toxin-antitoxin system